MILVLDILFPNISYQGVIIQLPSSQISYCQGRMMECLVCVLVHCKHVNRKKHCQLSHDCIITSYTSKQSKNGKLCDFQNLRNIRFKGLQLDALCSQAKVYCYLKFRLGYLKNLRLFSIKVKELFEPIVMPKKKKKGDELVLFLKAFP